VSDLYHRIARENTEPFQHPMTWYSNGQRGHLHHSQWCDKINRSRVATVTRELTLARALENNHCGECLGRGDLTDAQRDVVSAAQDLLRLERQLDMMHPNPLGTAEGPIADYRRHIFLTKAVEVAATIDTDGHLPYLKKKVLEKVSVPAKPGEDEIRAEALRYAATQTFWRLLSQDTNANPYWGGREITSLLGTPTWRDWSGGSQATNAIAKAGRTWSDLIQRGHAPEEATLLVVDSNEALDMMLAQPDWEMLAACNDLESPADGEHLKDYATRIWRTRGKKALLGLMKHWEQSVTAMMQPAEPVTIASDSHGSRGFSNMVCGTEAHLVIAAVQEHVLRQGERQERIALICHPTIGEYLSRTSGRSGWSEPVPAPKENPHEVLETALVLWDPWGRDGSYPQFPMALAAAEHI